MTRLDPVSLVPPAGDAIAPTTRTNADVAAVARACPLGGASGRIEIKPPASLYTLRGMGGSIAPRIGMIGCDARHNQRATAQSKKQFHFIPRFRLATHKALVGLGFARATSSTAQ